MSLRLSCCGFTHRTTSLKERELLQIPRQEQAAATALFKKITGAREAAVLATCNRIEFYRADPTKVDARAGMREFYAQRGVVDDKLLERGVFVRQGSSVARHLFKVAAGLDSELLGEYQVLSQVKEAYSAACSVNGPGPALHKLFHFAFSTAKLVRSQTGVGAGAQGLAGAAVDILRRQIGLEMTGKRALVIGVNKSTEMLLQHLQKESAATILFNRTLFKAEKLAHLFKAQAEPLEALPKYLQTADFVFSSTSSPQPIITVGMVKTRPPDHPLWIVDLAVPRDVEAKVGEAANVSVLDLDDLKHYLEVIQRERSVDLPLALEIVEQQVLAYEQWRRSASSNGQEALRQALEEDRLMILDRFKDNFREGDRKALEAFSRSLCRQILRRLNIQSAPRK